MARSVELVIASYREPLTWVADEWTRKFSVRVYNAAGRKFRAQKHTLTAEGLRVEPSERIKFESVPNRGREAGQWLHHLVSSYDSLADVTVFLQGDPFPHFPNLPDILGRETFAKPVSYIGLPMPDAPEPPKVSLLPDTYEMHAAAWGRGCVPRPGRFMVGAQFYVQKEIVLRRPRSHYEKYLAMTTDKRWPSFAHLIEGNWHSVFANNEAH